MANMCYWVFAVVANMCCPALMANMCCLVSAEDRKIARAARNSTLRPTMSTLVMVHSIEGQATTIPKILTAETNLANCFLADLTIRLAQLDVM